MTYLEVLIRCTIIAALVGGLHYWSRKLPRKISQRKPADTWFEGGKL